MRIKFGLFNMPSRGESSVVDYGVDREYDKRWRCCLCCHVRTGTIFLGVWHLALHMLSLAAIAVLVLHPQAIDPKSGHGGTGLGGSFIVNDQDVLPTPLSNEVREEPHALPLSPLSDTIHPVQTGGNAKNGETTTAKLFYGSFVYKDWFGDRQVSDHQHVTYPEDLNIGIGVTFCTLAITLLMIYGAIRGKSLYLMPFFCLQAFEFFVTSLSVIGYLSYVPDIRQTLIRNPNIPFRDELLAMDPQCLSLLVLAGILLTLVVKVYFISIVWNCYKYLTITAEAASFERESRSGGIIDGQNLLEVPSVMVMGQGMGSDLPDYATAMSDPRFAKKPMYPVPPPPYTAVVALPPEIPPTETAPIDDAASGNANSSSSTTDPATEDPKP